MNCYDVKWGARLQTVFTTMKVLAILLIIVAGFVVLCMGKFDNLHDPFEGTTTDPGHLSLALYSGLFSYAGWYANFVKRKKMLDMKFSLHDNKSLAWFSPGIISTL